MRCVIHVKFDTSDWQWDDLRWVAGFQAGVRITCEESEVQARVETVYALGHRAEVEYLP